LYKKSKYVTDKSGVKTIEVVGASFIANEETIFGDVNDDYVQRELEWYNSQSLYVENIPGDTPAIWKQIASSKGKINSNYGYLIYNKNNYDQYTNVLNDLVANPNSRRAVMIYTRPTMHKDFNVDGMSDFICTNAVQYLIRDNKVDCIVQMRSNDVVFGYRNDFAWQKHVLHKLTNELNFFANQQYDVGNIHWQVGSLHIYERHFKFIDNVIQKQINQKEAHVIAEKSLGDYGKEF
jgi:thymidylate synthase